MGVARDTYPGAGMPFSFVAGFAEVEVDVETGQYALLDYLGVADVGTVLHPRSLGGQILGRSMLGIATRSARSGSTTSTTACRWRRRFYQNRPPTILDAPQHMQWDALNIPDPGTPVGSRGIGEPPVAAGCNAVLNALIDAVGENVIPSRAGVVGHDPDVARSRTSGVRDAHGEHLTTARRIEGGRLFPGLG